MLKRVAYAALITVGGLALLFERVPPSAKAADQTTTLLVQLQSSVATLTGKLSGLDAKVTAMSDQARVERTTVLRRLSDDEGKIADLANGMADLDAARQNQTVVSLAARTAIIETKLDDAKRDHDRQVAQEKAQHDSMMLWVRPATMALFATLLSIISMLLTNHFRGRKADDDNRRVEEKIDKASAVLEKANGHKAREFDLPQDAQDDGV